jgi:hypothetical protein
LVPVVITNRYQRPIFWRPVGTFGTGCYYKPVPKTLWYRLLAGTGTKGPFSRDLAVFVAVSIQIEANEDDEPPPGSRDEDPRRRSTPPCRSTPPWRPPFAARRSTPRPLRRPRRPRRPVALALAPLEHVCSPESFSRRLL